MTFNAEGFKQWQSIYANLSERAKRYEKSVSDRAWELAASVGIPRCGCSLHNASIDDDMRGWCHNNPERLRVAKRANYMLNNTAWQASRIVDRVQSRAYQRLVLGK